VKIVAAAAVEIVAAAAVAGKLFVFLNERLFRINLLKSRLTSFLQYALEKD
jgi:hypothetical protein